MEEEHHGMEEGLMQMQRNLLELAGTAGWNSILLVAQSSTDTKEASILSKQGNLCVMGKRKVTEKEICHGFDK